MPDARERRISNIMESDILKSYMITENADKERYSEFALPVNGGRGIRTSS